MEFNFDVENAFSTGNHQERDGIYVIDARSFNPAVKHQSGVANQMSQVIDQIGDKSAIAQGLGATITTFQKLLQSENHIFYIKIEGNQAQGFIKTGQKNLFITVGGKMEQINARCVLDFYVHESMQRCGLGKQLFQKMLVQEKVVPWKLAYDRPSEKLLAFLAKHYLLTSYEQQVNHFVVYQQYFSGPTLQQQQKLEDGAVRKIAAQKQQMQQNSYQQYDNRYQSQKWNNRQSSNDQWSRQTPSKQQYSRAEIEQWSQPASQQSASAMRKQRVQYEEESGPSSYSAYPPPRKQQQQYNQYNQDQEESQTTQWASKSSSQQSNPRKQSWQPSQEASQTKSAVQWASQAQPKPEQERPNHYYSNQSNNYGSQSSQNRTNSSGQSFNQRSYQVNQYQREPIVQKQTYSYTSSSGNVNEISNAQRFQTTSNNSFQFYPAPDQTTQPAQNMHITSQWGGISQNNYYDNQAEQINQRAAQKKQSVKYNNMFERSKKVEWQAERDPTDQGVQWVSGERN